MCWRSMGDRGAMMTSKLTLTVLATAAVLAAPQAFAQGAPTQLVPNQTAKQDKRAVAPQRQTTQTTTQQQTAAPKPAPARAEKKPAAKPAEAMTAQQPAANPQAAKANPQAKKDVPRIEPKPLGRVSVDNQGSTFGFSSETKMKAYETPDGQRIRGLDHAITSNRQPSYFGLSLSVPTTSTSSGDAAPGFFPLPLPPRN